MTFSVTYGEPNSFSSAELKEIYGDEDKTAEINAIIDAYAEAYFTQVVYNG